MIQDSMGAELNVVDHRSFDAAAMPSSWHVVTYAELRFAPLTIHTRHLVLGPQGLEDFVSSVNAQFVSRSLLTRAPVSAVPRQLVRNPKFANALAGQIMVLMGSISVTTLVFDFGCPRLGAHVVPAIETGLADPVAGAALPSGHLATA